MKNVIGHFMLWVGYDLCDAWYHAKCLNMSTQSYAALEDSNVSWICMCGLPNFTSLFTSWSTVTENSYKVLSSFSSEDDIKGLELDAFSP